MQDIILNFIKNFQNEGTIKTFSKGCCFWFAFILETRFKNFDQENKFSCRIMYNQVIGHFACEIGGDLYDITGKIEYTNDWIPWVDWFLTEPSYREIVVRDCILKTEK